MISLLNTHRYWEDKPHQQQAIAALQRRIERDYPELLDESAEWVKLWRNPPQPAAGINAEALALIKSFESLSLTPYKDSVGVATIGWGNTWYADGRPVRMADPALTREQADKLFADVLQHFVRAVNHLVAGLALNANQLGALVSFAYNVGEAGLARSSVLRFTRQGNFAAARDSFLLWNQGTSGPQAGLSRRRCAEAALFAGENWRRFDSTNPRVWDDVAAAYQAIGRAWS